MSAKLLKALTEFNMITFIGCNMPTQKTITGTTAAACRKDNQPIFLEYRNTLKGTQAKILLIIKNAMLNVYQVNVCVKQFRTILLIITMNHQCTAITNFT